MTETAEVPGSACIALVVGDSVPDGVRDPIAVAVVVPVAGSDPFAEAIELGPPARAELKEYIDETDILFWSNSETEGRVRRAGSGN